MKKFLKITVCVFIALIMSLSFACNLTQNGANSGSTDISGNGGNAQSEGGSGGGFITVTDDGNDDGNGDGEQDGAIIYSDDEQIVIDAVNAAAIDQSIAQNVTYGDDVTVIDATDQAVKIDKSGNYLLSGDYTGGVTVAKNSGDVHLFLSGANIYNESGNALDIKGKNSVIITVTDGTTNSVKTDGKNALSSNVDLVINGGGTVSIGSTAKNGVKIDGELVIVGATLDIVAVNHGISAFAVNAEDCVISVKTASDGEAKDGIHAEMEDPASEDEIAAYGWTAESGYVILKNVKYVCDVEGDGIQADTFVYINGGDYDITTTAKFVSYSSANMTAYGLTMDDFRYRLGSDGVYYKQASDSQVSSGSYAMIQGTKGVKAGEIDYEIEDDNGDVILSGEITDGNYYIIIEGGNFVINSADDGIHVSSGSFTVSGGTFTINTLDDGLTADKIAKINAGDVSVGYCYEGIEGSYVIVNGGSINLGYCIDDGINAASDYNVSEYIEINGGNIYVNAYGDGLDSNGSITVTAGTVFVDGPSDNGNGSIDSETGVFINGGYVVAVGSSAWVREATPQTTSKQYSLVYAGGTIAAGTTFTLKDGSGSEIVSFKTAKNCSSVVISTPDIQSGATYVLYAGDNSLATFTVNSTVTTVGTSGGGGFGPGQGGPGQFGPGRRP